MARYNTSNNSYVDNNKSVYDVVLIGGNISEANNSSNNAVSGLGLDYSFNKSTVYVPNTYQAFAASGPYASFVLVGSVPANTARVSVDIENDSGSQIVIIRDDGTAANNVAGNNVSIFSLSAGPGLGAQGGSWSSTTFKGRIQIYAASNTAFVTVMVE